MTVSYTGDPQNVIEELITDGDGRTETLDLATPPLEYSLEPNVNQPYSEYTVKVEAEGYEPVEVTGSELLSGEQSVQQVDLGPAEGAERRGWCSRRTAWAGDGTKDSRGCRRLCSPRPVPGAAAPVWRRRAAQTA